MILAQRPMNTLQPLLFREKFALLNLQKRTSTLESSCSQPKKKSSVRSPKMTLRPSKLISITKYRPQRLPYVIANKAVVKRAQITTNTKRSTTEQPSFRKSRRLLFKNYVTEQKPKRRVRRNVRSTVKVSKKTTSKVRPTLQTCKRKRQRVAKPLLSAIFQNPKSPIKKKRVRAPKDIPNAPDSDDENQMDASYFQDNEVQNPASEWIVQPENENTRLKKRCKWLGVSWNTEHGKWIAQVGHQEKRYYVGQFEDCDLAARKIDEYCIFTLGIPPRNGTMDIPDHLKDVVRKPPRKSKSKRKKMSYVVNYSESGSDSEDWTEPQPEADIPNSPTVQYQRRSRRRRSRKNPEDPQEALANSSRSKRNTRVFERIQELSEYFHNLVSPELQ